jgi:hypothetical protein
MGIAAQSTEAKGLVLVETKMDGYPRALTLFTLLSKQALSPSPTNSGNQRGLNANELAGSLVFGGLWGTMGKILEFRPPSPLLRRWLAKAYAGCSLREPRERGLPSQANGERQGFPCRGSILVPLPFIHGRGVL